MSSFSALLQLIIALLISVQGSTNAAAQQQAIQAATQAIQSVTVALNSSSTDWHSDATSTSWCPPNAICRSVTTSTISTDDAHPIALPGGHCGGNFMPAPVCGIGYRCVANPASPTPMIFGDVGGICVANATSTPTGTSTPVTAPSVSGITPVTGIVGGSITIVGSNFDATSNTVLWNGMVGSVNAPSPDGKTLVVTVPGALSPNCGLHDMCPAYAMVVGSGSYSVAVKNSRGTSNGVTFGVSDGTQSTSTGKYSSLTISSPQSSDQWAAGSTHAIGWSYPVSGASISIALQGGSTGSTCPINPMEKRPCIVGDPFYLNIAQNIANSGAFSWTVPGLSPGMYSLNFTATNSDGSVAGSNSVTFWITSPSSTPATPTISSLSPSSAPVGTAITIVGNGFASQNNTVYLKGGPANSSIIQGLGSSDGKTISFTIPGMANAPTVACGTMPHSLTGLNASMCVFMTTPGTYAVSVSNGSSTSNSASLTVVPATASTSTASGISGTVTIMYCGGAHIGYDPNQPISPACTPTAGTSFPLHVKNTATGIDQTVKTDNSGAFSISLPVGTYAITPDSAQYIIGSSQPTLVAVTQGAFASASLSYTVATP